MSKHEINESKKKVTKIIEKIIFFLIVISGIIFVIKYDVINKVKLFINPILVENINISLEKTQLEIGEEIEIKTDVFPKDFTKSSFEWHCTNKDIIEFDNGKIVPKNLGKTTIYLTNDEIKSNEIQVECLVKIKEVSIGNPKTELKIGDIYQLQTKIIPENATYKNLIYESSNQSILQIDNNGNIIANGIGKSTITIKNDNSQIFNQLDIEVKKIPVSEIKLDDSKIKIGKGQKYIINATVFPVEATYTDITWTSSNTNIVKIKDREITAISSGQAKIVAITDNGDKKAECIVDVLNNNPSNEKKFAKGNYNIRTGNSTDYKIVATTNKYEEIEFLQDSKPGWKKVRNSKGLVGYTQIKENYYLKELPIENTSANNLNITNDNIVTSYHIKNVPYLNQISLGYPTGCEAVSATMLLKYKGYSVSVKNVVDNTKNGSKKYKDDTGIWHGANPFEEFVGNPSLGLGKGSYGVFAKPIVDAMKVYAGENVKNISGCSENDLFNYVSKGKPIVVWCVKNAGNLKEGVTWNYEGGTFKELIGEHCAVMIGYDENYVYLNDPSAGENVKQSKAKFISNWKTLYSQAIIVE